jgi:nitrite reductase (NADH) large subunit
MRLVVVGNGMVGHRFVAAAVERGLSGITVLGEERRAAYDRVHLSSVFDGTAPEELALAEPDWYGENGVELVLGDRAVALDPDGGTVTTAAGRTLGYDHCVLATGSYPFVPPIRGTDAAGCFVYRTLDDLDAIRAWATGCRTGVVVGGGLLGLEAANALRLLGLQTSVVEFAPRLMAVQLDEGGGRALRHHVEGLGLDVRTGAAADAVRTTPDGRVAGLSFAEGPDLDADLVVFAAGIRPRDELAREAGLAVGERGGVVVDDACATGAAGVWAIGEVACHRGRIHGLVAPGYDMAAVVADRIAGGSSTFEPTAPSVRLKLLGVDVATIGDPDAEGPVYSKVVRGEDGRLLGAICVGDLSPLESGADGALVCSCHNVGADVIRSAVRDGCEDVPSLKACTKAGTGCGSCVPVLLELLESELAAAGKAVDKRLCRHFAMTRAELFDVVRVTGIRRFADLVERHGSGRGCEICKPAVASMFASLVSGYILDGEQASLQDTNDHLLANLQRDGTYSVVPRVPGGEISPEGLIAIGEVARDFGLYTKITGGQRIDMFGARADQLPAIWARLVDAGFESGHAYGKAVRTVKSCVGSQWCRYGVQDSVQLAIDLELRYRGLRAPHKIKLAVSGCARECAEAQGKDVGIIATEKGWNLYVGGNGGMRPAHAELLASDLDTETLVRSIDRYLMYYVRTADRLERTATWQRKLPGGIDQVRRVVMEDALGIAADLEADMARHVAGYECEWKATLASPERLARFAAHTDEVPVELVTPDRGVAAEMDGERVAVFRLASGELFAIDDRDPFSGAPVLAKGIVGEVDGVPTVASPMYKQRFDLRSGECIDDPSVSVRTHEVLVSDGAIRVRR